MKISSWVISQFDKMFTKVVCCKNVIMYLKRLSSYNPLPHTTILQQTTLNIFCKNLYNWMDNLWLKVENIVAKGEIARLEQFLLLSLCFFKNRLLQRRQKASIWGKGLISILPCPSHEFEPRINHTNFALNDKNDCAKSVVFNQGHYITYNINN